MGGGPVKKDRSVHVEITGFYNIYHLLKTK